MVVYNSKDMKLCMIAKSLSIHMMNHSSRLRSILHANTHEMSHTDVAKVYMLGMLEKDSQIPSLEVKMLCKDFYSVPIGAILHQTGVGIEANIAFLGLLMKPNLYGKVDFVKTHLLKLTKHVAELNWTRLRNYLQQLLCSIYTQHPRTQNSHLTKNKTLQT
jgi:hypothetical protein